MSKNTFMMIKPDAVERGLIGDILKDITNAGFKIKALKLTQLSLSEAKTFYAIHSERPFFNDLTSYMSRSPIVAAVLEKDNAVSDFRNLIGDTDPSKLTKVQLEQNMQFLRERILSMALIVMKMQKLKLNFISLVEKYYFNTIFLIKSFSSSSLIRFITFCLLYKISCFKIGFETFIYKTSPLT